LVLSLTARQMVEDTQGCSSRENPNGVPTLRINDSTDIAAWNWNFCCGEPLRSGRRDNRGDECGQRSA